MKYKFICNECENATYRKTLDDEPIKCYKCNADNFGIHEVKQK